MSNVDFSASVFRKCIPSLQETDTKGKVRHLRGRCDQQEDARNLVVECTCRYTLVGESRTVGADRGGFDRKHS